MVLLELTDYMQPEVLMEGHFITYVRLIVSAVFLRLLIPCLMRSTSAAI